MAKKTFRLSDESVNSYGFRLLNKGADMTRFTSNPVMLFNHMDYGQNYTGPIGKWSNLRLEDGAWLADTDFDEEDDQAAVISGKVDRGFLKGASFGLDIISMSHDEELKLPGQTGPTVTEWKPFEASVVDIPGNGNSLALRYGGEVVVLKQGMDMAKLSFLKKDTTKKEEPNTHNMKEVALKLGLAADATEAQILEAVISLQKKRTEATAELMKVHDVKAQTLVKGAIASGKLQASQEETFVKLAKNDFDLAEKTIEAMEKKQTLKDQLDQSGGGNAGGEGGEDRADWSYMKWLKEDNKGLLKMQKEDPEKVAKLKKAYQRS